ncbi:Methyl-CpG DNA-binding [Sesbania bispinosa]|nr:Methyl-CpG DNA-binding [Sesbania bispinosa]
MRPLTRSGSIDIYAAQCKNCTKWRVIDTQEAFEEIRFEHGSLTSLTLPKTPQGFRRSLVLRKDYSKLDAYYITPTGKKLRTRNEIAAYLKDHPECKGIAPTDFDFSSPKIMQDTVPENVEQKDSVSANKKSKIAKDDI